MLPRLDAKTSLVFVAAASAPRPHASSLAVLARGVDSVEGRKGYLELLLGSRPSPSVTRPDGKPEPFVAKTRVRCGGRVSRDADNDSSSCPRARGCPELPGPAILVLGQVCCGVGEICSREKFLGSRHGLGAATTTRTRVPPSSSRRSLIRFWLSQAVVREPNCGLTRPLPAQK